MSAARPVAGAWLAGLLLAVPLLLPFSRAAELPVLLGALAGVWLTLRYRGPWLRARSAHALGLALGAYTLAALLSAPDALAPDKTWVTAAAALRLLAFGLGVLGLLELALAAGAAPSLLSRRLLWVAALPLALWVIDALLQAATGISLGGSLDADRLSGIFGADDLKLGPLLPALSPLLLWPLLGARRWLLALVWIAVLVVVLLAGSRAGWVSYAWVSALLAWRLAGGSRRLFALWLGLALLCGALAGAIGYQASDSFRARVDRTLAFGEGQADVALAGRVPIWQTASRMALAHPVNGVGVRGFRHAYPAYATPGDPWVDPVAGTGAAHAHQLFLELLTETGLAGLLLWLGAAWVLWRESRRGAADAATQAPWIALGALVFPLNTHLAFYSSFMGLVLAWLIALACAQSRLREVACASR